VSVSALTTGVPLRVYGPRVKKRSFSIEILLVEGGLEGGLSGADKFWQTRNDGLWQESSHLPFVIFHLPFSIGPIREEGRKRKMTKGKRQMEND
jgi:hypothetical protein